MPTRKIYIGINRLSDAHITKAFDIIIQNLELSTLKKNSFHKSYRNKVRNIYLSFFI